MIEGKGIFRELQKKGVFVPITDPKAEEKAAEMRKRLQRTDPLIERLRKAIEKEIADEPKLILDYIIKSDEDDEEIEYEVCIDGYESLDYNDILCFDNLEDEEFTLDFWDFEPPVLHLYFTIDKKHLQEVDAE